MDRDEKTAVLFACVGVPQMLRSMADDRPPGAVADLARKQAQRVDELLARCSD